MLVIVYPIFKWLIWNNRGWTKKKTRME